MDYQIDSELSCPKCHHEGLHNRDCTNFCEDGFFDEADDDPINFYPGESKRECDECKGTGVEWWCPNCGENLSGQISQLEHDEDLQHYPNEN